MVAITALSEQVSRAAVCGSGYLPGTVTMEVILNGVNPQNMTFLVCNPSSEMDDTTRLGLGLGLGLGIPAFLFILYKVRDYYTNKILSRNKYIKDSSLAETYQTMKDKQQSIRKGQTCLEKIFEKLGSQNYRDMLLDNITSAVKIDLQSLTTDELKYLKQYAEEHSKTKLLGYLTTELAV